MGAPVIRISYYSGNFPTPLDLVIITEFSDWLWEHIFASFSKKKERNGYSESLATLFPEQLCPFYGGL